MYVYHGCINVFALLEDLMGVQQRRGHDTFGVLIHVVRVHEVKQEFSIIEMCTKIQLIVFSFESNKTPNQIKSINQLTNHEKQMNSDEENEPTCINIENPARSA